jgi:S1-C subfamily serine protease
MALGDYSVEKITTKDGRKLSAGVIAADPVSDMAVLGALDDQAFFREANSFEEWCEATSPVPLAMSGPALQKPIRIRILSHRGNWITGKASRWGQQPTGTVWIDAESQIQGGTSGGPVIDSKGQLLGVISNVGYGADAKPEDPCNGQLPVACWALPRWVLLAISEAQRGRNQPNPKRVFDN